MSMNQSNELELQLRQLQVQPAELDRDQLLFTAGQRSVKRSWAWPTVTGFCLAMTAVSFLIRLPGEQLVTERIVYVSAELMPSNQIEAIPETPRKEDSMSYVGALKDLLENKPLRTTASYDSVKSVSIPTAGSYVEWFRQ